MNGVSLSLYLCQSGSGAAFVVGFRLEANLFSGPEDHPLFALSALSVHRETVMAKRIIRTGREGLELWKRGERERLLYGSGGYLCGARFYRILLRVYKRKVHYSCGRPA